MRVLVIEDDEAIASAIVTGLTREGFTPVRAATGAEALRSLPTDFILLDLGLPDRDGIELFEDLRAASPAPIIMVTARGAEHDRIAGLDLARQRAAALARVNFQASYAPLPGNLTVRQNLLFFGRLYALSALAERVDGLIETFALAPLARTRCGLLSSGEQTRVALAKALLNRPRLLLLDEPTASLDPATADDLRRLIRDLAVRERCAVLWTSHNMLEVEQVCDRVLLLARGRVLLQGDPRRLPAEHGAASLEALFIRIARQPLDHGDSA